MSIPQLISYADPLDLLRRFAPTPLKAHVHLASANVLLQTNDLSFLPSLSLAGSSVPPPSSQTCLWKIIRDVDCRTETAEASIIMAASLIVFSMGPAVLIGADRERKEILAFIGLDVDARVFQESIVPALCRLTEFVMRRGDTSETARGPNVAVGGQCNA